MSIWRPVAAELMGDVILLNELKSGDPAARPLGAAAVALLG